MCDAHAHTRTDAVEGRPKWFSPCIPEKSGPHRLAPLILLMPIHLVICPYCYRDVFIESEMDHVVIAQRKCPTCGREFPSVIT